MLSIYFCLIEHKRFQYKPARGRDGGEMQSMIVMLLPLATHKRHSIIKALNRKNNQIKVGPSSGYKVTAVSQF